MDIMEKHPEFKCYYLVMDNTHQHINQKPLNCLLLNVTTTVFISRRTLQNWTPLNNFGPSWSIQSRGKNCWMWTHSFQEYRKLAIWLLTRISIDTSVTLSPASMVVSMMPLFSVVYLCHFLYHYYFLLLSYPINYCFYLLCFALHLNSAIYLFL